MEIPESSPSAEAGHRGGFSAVQNPTYPSILSQGAGYLLKFSPLIQKKGGENLILHSFPNPQKECNRFRTWTCAVGGSILALDDTYIFKYRRICHLHFEERYWTRSKMLSKNAIPTLHMTGVVQKHSANTTKKNVSECSQDFLTAIASTSNNIGIVLQKPLANSTNKNVVTECFQETASTSKRIDLKIATRRTLSSKKISNLKKNIKRLTKENEQYAIKIKKAMKLAENRTFQRTLKKFTPLAAIFTALQFREAGKDKMGRRFTEEEKIMALTIYRHSPHCYRFLENIFILPSPLTLTRMLSKAAESPA